MIPAHGADRRVLVSDSFIRDNNTTELGYAESGQLWTANSGTWGINGKAAYVVSTDTVDHVASVDCGRSNFEYSCEGFSIPENPGHIFRMQDATNYLLLLTNSTGSIQFYKRVAGTYTSLLQSAAGLVVGAQHTIRIVANGSTITGSVNGKEILRVVDTTFQYATRVGLRHQIGSSTNIARWRRFVVKSL